MLEKDIPWNLTTVNLNPIKTSYVELNLRNNNCW